MKGRFMTKDNKLDDIAKSLDEIDIFDPNLIYPSETKLKEKEAERKKEKPSLLVSKEDYRKQLRDQADRRRTLRHINNVRATDEYVRSLERQVVDAKTYLTVKNLDNDFEKFNKQIKERANAKVKGTQKKNY